MRTDALRGGWLARRVHPARVLLYARLGSTDRTAVQLLDAGTLRPPALLAASRQTAGRGRGAHLWWSDAGSLCATFLLPADSAMPLTQVPLRAGVAVAEIVAAALPECRVQVKWPNDVLVDDLKIAGLLCRRERDTDIIGIGLNVRTDIGRAPREIRACATSMAEHLRRPPRREEVLVALWQSLCARRASGDWLDRYEKMHALAGRCITIREDAVAQTGTCRGIDALGRLLLDSGPEILALTDGTVTAW